MDDESLCELMGRVAALEAALSAILSSSGIDAAVRAGALASLEKMAAVFELGGEPEAKAFSSGWRMAIQNIFAGEDLSRRALVKERDL